MSVPTTVTIRYIHSPKELTGKLKQTEKHHEWNAIYEYKLLNSYDFASESAVSTDFSLKTLVDILNMATGINASLMLLIHFPPVTEKLPCYGKFNLL